MKGNAKLEKKYTINEIKLTMKRQSIESIQRNQVKWIRIEWQKAHAMHIHMFTFILYNMWELIAVWCVYVCVRHTHIVCVNRAQAAFYSNMCD